MIYLYQASRGDEESARIISQISSQLNSGAPSSEQQELMRKQALDQIKIETDMRAKEQAALAELERELTQALANLERQSGQQKQMVSQHIEIK